MRDVTAGFHSFLNEVIFLLILDGIFAIIFAVLIFFYPPLLVALAVFLLVLYGVFAIYFGLRVWGIKRKVQKFLP